MTTTMTAVADTVVPQCPCGTDEYRSDLDGSALALGLDGAEIPSCHSCERFCCEGCSTWVPWEDGADDEDATLCNTCSDAITARPRGSSR